MQHHGVTLALLEYFLLPHLRHYSYHKAIHIDADYYDNSFYLILLSPLTAILQLIN